MIAAMKLYFMSTAIVFTLGFCSGQSDKKPKVVCSSDTFFQHPDPDSCTSFYKCDASGKPVKFDCPSGLHYSPTEKVCDWPQNAGCDSSEEDTNYPVDCPSVKDGSTVRVMNPDDSKTYYLCDSKGVPTLKNCPTSTVYDVSTKKCKNEKTQNQSSKTNQNQGTKTDQGQSQSKTNNNEDNGNTKYNWDAHW